MGFFVAEYTSWECLQLFEVNFFQFLFFLSFLPWQKMPILNSNKVILQIIDDVRDDEYKG